MTQRQAIVAAVVCAVVAAAMVVGFLMLPLDASWSVNRWLKLGWQLLAGALAAGGMVWCFWPREKASRKDLERKRSQRRVVGLGVVIVAATALVIFAELRCEWCTQNQVSGAATEDLRAIGKALDAYRATHGGTLPPTLETLVPQYLDAGRLHYAYRDGPKKSPTVSSVIVSGEGAPPATYRLAIQTPIAGGPRTAENLYLAYLRPGMAWAPMTVVLRKDGKTEIVGEDVVRAFEERYAAANP